MKAYQRLSTGEVFWARGYFVSTVGSRRLCRGSASSKDSGTLLKSILDFWIGEGAKIFRVDNPHTKARILGMGDKRGEA